MSNRLKRWLFAVGLFCFIVVILFSVNTDVHQSENIGLAGFVEIEDVQEIPEEPFWSELSPNSTLEDLSEENIHQHSSMNLETVRRNIENALGLTVASVRVSLEDQSPSEVAIPWREHKQPVVRVSLPSSWVTMRTSQVGNKDLVFESLRTIIASVLPGSKTTFNIVQVSPSIPHHASTQESYAKQIVLLIGLFGVLFASFIVDHRKSPREEQVVRNIKNPTEEAKRILELSYDEAIHAIDALHDPHKMNVLRSIAACDVEPEETPVLQVEKQTQRVGCS